MFTLENNEQVSIVEGLYTFKATGALDVQVQFRGEGFDTITDGSFDGVTTGVMQLPRGDVKIINAGSNKFIFSETKVNE